MEITKFTKIFPSMLRSSSSSYSVCSAPLPRRLPLLRPRARSLTSFCFKATSEAMTMRTESISAAGAEAEDPGTAFKLLLACPSGLSRSQLSVDFDPSYDRIPHPLANLEDSINEYGGHSLQNADGLNQVASVCLHLGLTDYRTFMGTNLNPLWEKFLVTSEDDVVLCQHTSSPLGNGAVVETSDEKILVLQRSKNVGEFPGYFVFPGGHSEPHEVGILTHQTDKGSAESEILNQKITQEMFDGIIREVVEEIGVPANSLTDPIFLGISRRDMNVRPTAFFFLKCNLESDVVNQLYMRAQDGYESTQLYAVSRVDLEKMAPKMPGCHHGGYALYELMTRAAKPIKNLL